MARKEPPGARGGGTSRRRAPSAHVETKRKARRARILESAVRSFGAKGFYGTSMDDIAEELLMTRGSLYYYFRDKEEIVDPKLAAFAILGAMNWMARWYRAGGGASADEIGEAFASLFLDGLASAR